MSIYRVRVVKQHRNRCSSVSSNTIKSIGNWPTLVTESLRVKNANIHLYYVFILFLYLSIYLYIYIYICM